MDALQKDFWIQFIASFVRKGLFAIGALLESYGVFTHDQTIGITTTAVVMFLTGLIIQGLMLLWQYAKTNGTFEALKKAVQIDPPIDVTAKSIKAGGPTQDEAVAQAVLDVKSEVAADKSTLTTQF